jgi:alpha-galactosidase
MLALTVSPRATEIVRHAELEDAFVELDESLGRWVIGTSRIIYAIRITRARELVVDHFGMTDEPSLLRSDAPDAMVTLDGETFRIGGSDSPFRVVGVNTAATSQFVSLSIQLASNPHGLLAVRHYVVYPRTAAVEMWTEFQSDDGRAHTVGDLNASALAIPAGDVEWLSGLDTPFEAGGPFSRRRTPLSDGESITIGSSNVSSSTAMPYVSVGSGHTRVFSGLLWSGTWSAWLHRSGDDLHTTMGLGPMSATVRPDRSVEGPHAFLGAVGDSPGADTAAVSAFVRAGRGGRDFPAWTTFNTWFVYGIQTNEESVLRSIEGAAQVGIEQYQLDAGWYRPTSEPSGPFDFTNGLGSWEVDSDRFPSGLSALANYARERGVRFGIWVEPERVALSTVGRDGLAQPSFLAQQDGQYEPGVPNQDARDAQVCLGNPAARDWVLSRVTRFIDEVGADNIKWDFNRWVTCTRGDHGHLADGGNYEHTRGLYEILAALRERYPGLTIENCAGGGHRIDFALARLTDSAWMDDRTSPASHVRRNLHGLSWIWPTSYLFSYLLPHPDEPLRGFGDIPLLARSRMPGMFGLAAEVGALSELEVNIVNQEIELSKSLRNMLRGANTYALTPQDVGYGEWEVFQRHEPASGLSVVFAFSNGAHDPIRVLLRGISPNVRYELRSADRGRLGILSGADLIAGGLSIEEAQESGAQILVLEPMSGPEARPR